MGSAGVVFFEPAPFDFAFALFIPYAFIVGKPATHSRLTIPFVAMFILLVTNLASVAVTDDPSSTLRFLAISIYLFAAWFMLTLLVTRHGRPLAEYVLASYSFGVALAAVIGLAGFIGLLPLGDLVAPSGRLRGLFKDPNVFGAAVIPALIFALARLGSDAPRRLLWLPIAGACSISVVLSYSRGSWVNAAVTLTAFYGLRLLGSAGRRTGVRTVVGFCLGMAFLVPLLWWVLELPTVQDMLQIRLRYQNYDTNRFATQLDAVLAAIEHPLGVGPGMSETIFSRATHSLYVRALIENGPVGLLAVLTLLFSSLGRATWRGLTTKDEGTRTLLCVVAGLLWGLTAESFVIDSVHWRHFWIVLALAWTPSTVPRTRP
jgi:hypothetical protein